MPDNKITRKIGSNSGFTLVEVLLALVLLGVLLNLILSSFDFLNSSRLVSARDIFINAIHRTRNEAINHNQRVNLCKSQDLKKCANSAGFEQGWLSYVDSDEDGKLDSGEKILQKFNANFARVTIMGNRNFKNRISYMPTGDSTAFGRFVLCDAKYLKTSEMIFVNSTGKPRIAPDNNRNLIPEDNNNKDIDSCLTDVTYLD